MILFETRIKKIRLSQILSTNHYIHIRPLLLVCLSQKNENKAFFIFHSQIFDLGNMNTCLK